MKKLIILCATQRCGSTMIVEDFRNTKKLGKGEEYFIPWRKEKELNWIDQFNNILNVSRTENGISTIKIMADQLSSIEACLENFVELNEDESAVLFPKTRKILSNAWFVRIRRNNTLRQAVSRVISRQTGVNHALSSEDAMYKPGNLLKANNDGYNKNVTFNANEISAEMLKISQESCLWDEVLRSWGVNSPLELYYEQVCRAYPSYLDRVGKYVGVDVSAKDIPEVRNLKKLSNNKNEELINRYISSIIR